MWWVILACFGFGFFVALMFTVDAIYSRRERLYWTSRW